MSILMHKDIPVAKLYISHGKIQDVIEIYNKEHMPVGTVTEFDKMRGRLLENWNKMRAIPQGRQDLSRIEQVLGCSTEETKIKSMAVSLTDCYWIKDVDIPLKWKDVNYYDNGFSTDFAKALLYDNTVKDIDIKIPDLTTDGALKKTWINMNGKPVLLKFGNYGPERREKSLQCANEVAASRIADIMGIGHVPYFPVRIEGKGNVICGCECFITDESTEFVNALQLLKEMKSMNGMELYQIFKKIGMKEDIHSMILFDHIIHNIDRHEKNFGILRDADTLEIIGFAPLFDSGSSLGWSQGEMKPFLYEREKQLSLIEHMGEVPDPKQIKSIIQEVYSEFPISEESFDIACKEIEISFQMIADLNRSWRGTEIYNKDAER